MRRARHTEKGTGRGRKMERKSRGTETADGETQRREKHTVKKKTQGGRGRDKGHRRAEQAWLGSLSASISLIRGL